VKDWLRAESELLNSAAVEISEADDRVIVRTQVPGFRDKDIEVRVEPHRLAISGKREQIRELKEKEHFSDARSNEVFRMLDLPEEVDPDKVRATLREGTLGVALPKSHPSEKVPVEVKAA
jgi:HSP20 family protein